MVIFSGNLTLFWPSFYLRNYSVYSYFVVDVAVVVVILFMVFFFFYKLEQMYVLTVSCWMQPGYAEGFGPFLVQTPKAVAVYVVGIDSKLFSNS